MEVIFVFLCMVSFFIMVGVFIDEYECEYKWLPLWVLSFFISLSLTIASFNINEDKIIEKEVTTTLLETRLGNIESKKPIKYIIKTQTYKKWSTFNNRVIELQSNEGLIIK